MLKTERYKFSPINDSLNLALSMLVKYIESKYDVFDITYKSKITPDETKVGHILSDMKRPVKIYVKVHHMHNGSWTNAGGTLHCTLILMDKSTIDIRWDTAPNSSYDEKFYEEFSIAKIRKLKLEKLNMYDVR